MLAVIDYGAGNLKSVVNALDFLGCPNQIVCNANEIKSASALILPGVGAFGAAVDELEKRGLTDAVKQAAQSKPFLGICLGMQLLFETSEESPDKQGLCLLRGKVKHFPKNIGLKIPHIGWNSIKKSEQSKLFSETQQDSYFYFVHSYYCTSEDKSAIAARCQYGIEFDAAVEKDNLFGCQFHPEKSGSAGLALLRKFASLFGGVD